MHTSIPIMVSVLVIRCAFNHHILVSDRDGDLRHDDLSFSLAVRILLFKSNEDQTLF